MRGRLEVIAGGMFAGKTETLIVRLRRAVIARQKVMAFKHNADIRYDVAALASHGSDKFEGIPIDSGTELLSHVRKNPEVRVIGIDEVQFFDDSFASVCDALATSGLRVITAGLDMDYAGRPFAVTAQLLSMADKVTKVRAVCVRCGRKATRSFRRSGGSERFLVGVHEYEARCRSCWADFTTRDVIIDGQ